MRRLLLWALSAPLAGCGNCQVGADPIPGGFDPAARLERAAQVRLTRSGLDVLSVAADGWIRDAAVLSCSGDADCPAALGSSCVGARCSGGAFAAIDLAPASVGAIDVCTSGTCRVFVAIDRVSLAQSPPSALTASIDTRLASTPIPIHDRATGVDCTAQLDLPGPAAVDVELTMAPGSSGQIGFTVTNAVIPALVPSGGCSAPVTADLRAAIRAAAIPAVRDLVASAVGQVCDVTADCPAGAGCANERCLEGDQILLPGLEDEERITVPPVLDSYDTPDAVSDFAIQVGGAISADPAGITAGVRGGMELVSPNPSCATVLPSPRLRPTFTPTPPLPATETVDLDYDGTPETSYQVALSLSKAFVDQAIWSAYGGGLVCGAVTTADYDDLHTGTLEIIIPSVRFLTKSRQSPRSQRPARVSAWLRQEPEIQIGSGETHENGGSTEYVDPLVHLYLRDFEINLSALIEERWVRILTATLDLHLGIAVMVTPDNQLEPIVGVGVPEIIGNVRITNSELLQEDPASIAQALPTLLSFALLEFAGSAGQFPLPTLEGTDLDVLGIRGVPGPSGSYDQLALYADLALQAGGNLTAAAETEASLVETRTPSTEAFSIDHAGGPVLPEIELALAGHGAGPLEWQTRVDGGFWSAFGASDRVVISRPELAIQGRHRIEARARVKGQYRSLDPTPAVLDVWIDSEPPELAVQGRTLSAWDRVSGDRITVEAVDASGTHPLALDADGHATLAPDVRRVRATDEAGRVGELVLKDDVASTDDAEAFGCTAAGGAGSFAGLWIVGLLALVRTLAWPRGRRPRRAPSSS